eukprot:EG_transcript_45875
MYSGCPAQTVHSVTTSSRSSPACSAHRRRVACRSPPGRRANPPIRVSVTRATPCEELSRVETNAPVQPGHKSCDQEDFWRWSLTLPSNLQLRPLTLSLSISPPCSRRS